MKRVFQYFYLFNRCNRAAQRVWRISLSPGVSVWLTQCLYAQRSRSLCEIRLTLRIDTLISTAICFCLCSRFCFIHSQAAWITFHRCSECRRPSLAHQQYHSFFVSLHHAKDKLTVNPNDFSRVTILLRNHLHSCNALSLFCFHIFQTTSSCVW